MDAQALDNAFKKIVDGFANKKDHRHLDDERKALQAFPEMDFPNINLPVNLPIVEIPKMEFAHKYFFNGYDARAAWVTATSTYNTSTTVYIEQDTKDFETAIDHPYEFHWLRMKSNGGLAIGRIQLIGKYDFFLDGMGFGRVSVGYDLREKFSVMVYRRKVAENG